MLKPVFPYNLKHARKFEWVPCELPRSDRRYRRRCSTCRKFLAQDRKSSYCKGCQTRRVQRQRVDAVEKKRREWRGTWRASINVDVLQEDDWWIFWIEPDSEDHIGWIKARYAYAFRDVAL